MKHKHCDLIKAWADGAEIQYKGSLGWCDCYGPPAWSQEGSYRIKPKTIKYRNYLWRDSTGGARVYACTNTQSNVHEYACHKNFIKWLGDWQEVIVE